MSKLCRSVVVDALPELLHPITRTQYTTLED
jgi:hypothetical protein